MGNMLIRLWKIISTFVVKRRFEFSIAALLASLVALIREHINCEREQKIRLKMQLGLRKLAAILSGQAEQPQTCIRRKTDQTAQPGSNIAEGGVSEFE